MFRFPIRAGMIAAFILTAFAAPIPARAAASAKPSLDVRAFGAKGDGKSLDSPAIQTAVDQVSQAGGGIVRLPVGTYLAGTIQIKKGVTLHLDKGATLLGSSNPSDYQMIDPFVDGVGSQRGKALVVATDAAQVGIDGPGTIDGQGAAFHSITSAADRPFLVRFSRCQGVRVQGVTLRQAGSWTSNYSDCDHVQIQNVTIASHGNPNNDGMDIDACRQVVIQDCDVSSDDDALCFKTTLPKPCRDITVTGCRLSSRCGAIKFGTESMGPFENFTISHCDLHDTGLGGIKILSVDGSVIRHVTISHLTMERVDMPIFLRLGARRKTFHPGDARQPIGALEQITIRDITVTGAAPSRLKVPTAIFVTGIPGHSVRNVTLEGIHIQMTGGGVLADIPAVVPEKETAYPEYNAFSTLPAYGIYLRHVESLTLRDIQIQTDQPDLRPLVACDDAQAVTLVGLHAVLAPGAAIPIRLSPTSKINVVAPALVGAGAKLIQIMEPESSLPLSSPAAPGMTVPIISGQ